MAGMICRSDSLQEQSVLQAVAPSMYVVYSNNSEL